MKQPYKVVLTDYEYETLHWEESEMSRIGANLIKCQCKTEEELISATHDADAIMVQYARITRPVIQNLKHCKVIVRYGVGIDCIDVKAATEHGIPVVNVPDYGLEDIADHAMALLLNSARKICLLNNSVKNGVWNYKESKPLYRMRGKVLGLVAFGTISRMVAQKALAFGLEVQAFDPYVEDKVFEQYGVKSVHLEELLCTSDFISLHAPVTENTYHMINKDTLALLRPNCIIINTARGALIDEDALARALDDHAIAGIAMDVSEQEPINKDNPLLLKPNVIITPHAAWYTEEAQDSLQRQVAQEVARVLTGTRPNNLVNPQYIDFLKMA